MTEARMKERGPFQGSEDEPAVGTEPWGFQMRPCRFKQYGTGVRTGAQKEQSRADRRKPIKSTETDVGVYGNLTGDKGVVINQQGMTGGSVNGIGKTGPVTIWGPTTAEGRITSRTKTDFSGT